MNGRLIAVAMLSALAMGMAGCSHIQSIARLVRPAPLVKTTAIAPAPAQQAPEAGRERLYRQAVAAMDQRDYGLALDLLQLARSAGPDDARVLNGLGVVYDKLQRFDLSARYYDLAEKADPGSRIVEANRRYSQLLQGRGVGTGSGTRLAQGSAAAPTHTADGVLLIGRPIRLLNATGAPDGVLAVAANLERAGWSISGAGSSQAPTRRTSAVYFAQADLSLAAGLVRTLPFQVALEPCGSCQGLDVVVGSDALSPPRKGSS